MCAVLNQKGSHELATVAGLCVRSILYTESTRRGKDHLQQHGWGQSRRVILKYPFLWGNTRGLPSQLATLERHRPQLLKVHFIFKDLLAVASQGFQQNYCSRKAVSCEGFTVIPWEFNKDNEVGKNGSSYF